MDSQLSLDFRFESRAAIRRFAAAALEYEARLFDAADIEPVHEMRVSLNKLRVCLRFFSEFLPKRLRKSAEPSLAWFKDCLGSTRDLDVAAELLRSLGSPGEAEAPGVRFAMESLEDERRRAAEALRKAMDLQEYAQTKSMLLDLAALGEKRKPKPAEKLKPSNRLDVQLPALLARLMARFRKRRKTFERAYCPQTMHSMRISGKRVRYVVSFFQTSNPGVFKPVEEAFDALHDCTGSLHDIDVMRPWLERLMLRQLLNGDSETTGRLEPGMEWLQARLRDRRAELLRELRSIWANLRSEEFDALRREICRIPERGE